MIKTCFKKYSHYLRNQEPQKWQSVMLKLVKYFKSIGLSPTMNFEHGHIYKICENVISHVNYRKKTGNDFIPKYEVALN